MAAKTQMRDLALALLALLVSSMPGFAAAAAVPAESLESLHDKAKSEGGKLTLYMPLSNRAMEVIPPAFMKRFPGVTVNHIDATPDQLLARASAEARGGRVLADVFGGSLPYMAQAVRAKTDRAGGAAGSRGISREHEKRVLGGDGYSILHRGLEYQSCQKGRRAQELRGACQSKMEGSDDGRGT